MTNTTTRTRFPVSEIPPPDSNPFLPVERKCPVFTPAPPGISLGHPLLSRLPNQKPVLLRLLFCTQKGTPAVWFTNGKPFSFAFIPRVAFFGWVYCDTHQGFNPLGLLPVLGLLSRFYFPFQCRTGLLTPPVSILIHFRSPHCGRIRTTPLHDFVLLLLFPPCNLSETRFCNLFPRTCYFLTFPISLPPRGAFAMITPMYPKNVNVSYGRKQWNNSEPFSLPITELGLILTFRLHIFPSPA